MAKSRAMTMEDHVRAAHNLQITVMFFLVAGIIFVLASVIINIVLGQLDNGLFSVSVVEQQVADSGALLEAQRQITRSIY